MSKLYTELFINIFQWFLVLPLWLVMVFTLWYNYIYQINKIYQFYIWRFTMYGLINNTNTNCSYESKDQSKHFSISNNKYTVSFCGTLYNEETLWNILSKDTLLSEHKCTEALIANLYVQLGESFVSHLNGMFSFTIYNHNAETLFGARDRFGAKPLYYLYTKEDFVYASQISSILSCNHYKPAPNRTAINKYMDKGYRVGAETMFEGIYSLPAAHTFIYKGNKLTTTRYYTPSLNIDANNDLSASGIDMNNYLSDAINSALQCCNTHSLCTGAFLQKDFMSSYLTALAKPDNSLSIHFDFDKCSESTYITELSNLLRIDNSYICATTNQCIDAIKDIISILEEPVPLNEALPAFFMCTNALTDYDRIICGACGELLTDIKNMNTTLTDIERIAGIYTKLSAASNIDICLPYLNNNLFNAVCELPNEYRNTRISKAGKLIKKNIFRQAASKHLSGYFTEQIHEPRSFPIAAWLRSEKYYNLFKKVLSHDATKEYLNQPMLLKALKAHKSGKADNSAILLRAYMFVLWYERFFD